MAATADEQVENPFKESGAKKLARKNKKQRTTKKKKKIRIRALVPGLSCFKKPTLEIENDDGNSEGDEELRSSPSHLIVTVNGFLGSVDDWKYAVEQFLKQYPKDVLVHCSKRNSATLSFDGVDVMGERLADEVISVIKRYPDLRKISFLGHSLGGLISRYAVASLYQRNCLSRHPCNDGEDVKHQSSKEAPEENSKKEVAALEPINFITFATPHLGLGGSKQVPLFGGNHSLEKIARQTSGLLGRTGKHLFLTDNDDGKPPLLLQMTNDYGDLPFISALKSFRRRVLYANARYDYIVGWSTSSLRRRKELPQRQSFSRNNRYRHIVNVETAKHGSSEGVYPLDSAVDGWKRFDTNAMMEAMLSRLTKLEWERVDVEFTGTRQRFLAHNTIQVASFRLHSQGADVIQHMIDNFLL
ncbi:hypothetical protein Droror1_Dr00009257 [Drosera rotundifolia]